MSSTEDSSTVLDDLLTRPQYSIAQSEKERLLLPELARLTEWHRTHSDQYRRILALDGRAEPASMTDVPYLPVTLFKTHRLTSVAEDEVFKTMTSSGTTGQQVSRIVLDRTTAARQTKALSSIMTHVLGPKRIPMIIVDTPNVVRDRTMFSARGAGVLGMLSYGRDHFYCLDDDMRLDRDGLLDFVERHQGQSMLIFGFTFMVWKYFYQEIRNLGVDLSQATLIHSGGWKKLIDEAVDNPTFRARFAEDTGMQRIHNFYGMVEQVGGVYLEGPDGCLHPPNFGEVIIRDPQTWREAEIGQPGVIQVLSILPVSYPGHSILTEDLGVIEGVSEPGPDTWGGKQLRIIGRIPKAELRGCSDTHATEAMAS